MKLTKHRPSPAMIVALLALFVALGGVGVAATGGNFILGKPNSAGSTSSLTSGVTTGPTLYVTNSGGKPAARFDASGTAPFTVNNAKKVQNLNADQLDGIDSGAFARKTDLYWWNIGGIPAGFADGTDDVGYYHSVQFSGTLAAGASQLWSTYGYSASQYVAWNVIPTTIGGQMSITSVEKHLDGDGTLTYYITVKNTGSITSDYKVERWHFTN